ncbi:MAG: LCP family protein [Dehalococcoidia bacterium]
MDDIEAYGQLQKRPIPTGPRPSPPMPAPPRKRRSHWLRNIILLALAYVVAAVVTAVQPIPLASARLSVPFPGGAPLIFGLPDRPFTVLVMGLDRRPTDKGPSRTDTILLLRIDPNAHRAAFLSIPRDSMMQVPKPGGGWTRDRINTAYFYDWSSKHPSAAPKALMATIEHNLGIKVDYYVTWDQYGAEKLITAMGGVTIDNPRAFGQADYSDDDIHVVPQQFPVGKQHLDGYQAVAYGRIRQGSSDLDRILRQQRVAAALIADATSPSSLFRIPAVWRAYRQAIGTDMSMRQSAGVLAMLKRVPAADLKTASLGDAAVPCNSCVGALLLLVPSKVQQIVADAFGDPAAGQRAAELLVAAHVAG